MGTDQPLNERGTAVHRGDAHPRRASGQGELPRVVFLGVAVGSSALLIALSRHVFLFWDDFVFLGEARDSHLTWSYLTDPLFRHFSPLVRVANLLVVGAIPNHPWIIASAQSVLLAGVASSVTWLMVVLHGRTGPGLVGSLLLAPSLTLLPLGNWWTAGVNIMPALIGVYVSFGAMVLLLRGRRAAWGVVCLAGAAMGVLDYELPMLLVGYLALWFVLFGSRVTQESVRATWRRTWWAWVGLAAICFSAAVNYRLNYYDPVPRPSTRDIVHALGRSLVRTLIPTVLGYHDPRSAAFSELCLLIGCVVLVLLVSWLALTRRGAWRGLLFAGAGWLLPTAALVLNRVSIFGVSVVDNVIYFHLPTVLFAIGVLEAWLAPRREQRLRLEWALTRVRRPVVALVILLMVGGYGWSARPTARYQLPVGATPSYVEHARRSVAALRARGLAFSVVNSDVPGFVAPGTFAPWNRADRVLGVAVPRVTFDRPTGALFQVSQTGDLVPVHIDWLAEATPSSPSTSLRLRDAVTATGAANRLCFVAGPTSSLVWALTSSVAGPNLVVRTIATVDETSPVRVVVRAEGKVGFDHANPDAHQLGASSDGVLDTVSAASIATLRVKGFLPGAHVCLDSVAVGRVITTAAP